MTPSSTCCFIVNPTSAGGRTKHNWEKLIPTVKSTLSDRFFVKYTDSIGSATRLTREALEEGADVVVSVGGDGTNNEVVNGFFNEESQLIKPDARFAFFPMGTGGDLRRTLPFARNIRELLQQVQGGREHKLDLGKVTFLGASGHETQRYFLNITSIGISGTVNQLVNRSKKRLGGTATFFLATAQAMLTYKNPTFRISIDEKPAYEKTCHVLIVANGRYFGGGMKAAPGAEMDDGLFDMVTIGDYNRRTLLLKGSLIYQGRHIEMPDTTVQHIQKIKIECDRDIWIDIDGEVPGHTPATIEMMPQALPVLLP